MELEPSLITCLVTDNSRMPRWVRAHQDDMAHTRMIISDAITALPLAAATVAAALGERAFTRPPSGASMS